ncbi:MAG: single-stranded-DNA-specific exonuclease RecJ, partial [Candidatus Omnitrophica bacterium]|nr:single-stranded-DNA-specific exonuclease RecJ [Candidatus Omnitrophota bacterium]
MSSSPLFSRILELRGFTDPQKIDDFLNPALGQLKDPFQMKGVREACDRIGEAIRQREKILIHGDYDVDGVTGAAILSRTLRILKADFQCFLPDRAGDGYG